MSKPFELESQKPCDCGTRKIYDEKHRKRSSLWRFFSIIGGWKNMWKICLIFFAKWKKGKSGFSCLFHKAGKFEYNVFFLFTSKHHLWQLRWFLIRRPLTSCTSHPLGLYHISHSLEGGVCRMYKPSCVSALPFLLTWIHRLKQLHARCRNPFASQQRIHPRDILNDPLQENRLKVSPLALSLFLSSVYIALIR